MKHIGFLVAFFIVYGILANLFPSAALWIGLALFMGCCFFMIFVILMQSGKGGGLSSLGGASDGISEAFGATGAEKALNNLTTVCAVGFMGMSICLALVGSSISNDRENLLGEGEERAAETTVLDESTAQTTAAGGTGAPIAVTPGENGEAPTVSGDISPEMIQMIQEQAAGAVNNGATEGQPQPEPAPNNE